MDHYIDFREGSESPTWLSDANAELLFRITKISSSKTTTTAVNTYREYTRIAKRGVMAISEGLVKGIVPPLLRNAMTVIAELIPFEKSVAAGAITHKMKRKYAICRASPRVMLLRKESSFSRLAFFSC